MEILRALEAYAPCNEQEERDRREILRAVNEHEDIFLCVQIIVIIPLCGRTCHHTYTVFLCKSMIEYEVVVPQVGE